MAKIKSMERISSKWSTVAGRSTDAYQDGVLQPRTDWKKATQASNTNWKAATQQAIAQDRFAAGVNRSSTENWQAGAIDKGVSRYAAGVQLGQPAYEAGFAPYRAVIEAVNLPDRKPKGDPANIQRVAMIATALHNAKVAATGTPRR